LAKRVGVRVNVLLVDVDSKIPNLALMKLSEFYKRQDYTVEMQRLGFNGYPSKKSRVIINNTEYDKVYASCIFSVNADRFGFESMENVKVGGTGVNAVNLSPEIDSIGEDYGIYPNNKSSYGFITRGCPRKCSFCVVPEKEGGIYKYRTVDQIVKHNKVFFMDNNILAYRKHLEVLEEIKDKKLKCQFNQGLDIRLITDANAKALSELNYIGNYTFAFDHIRLAKIMGKKLETVKKHISSDWKCRMFVLGGYDSSIRDDLWRIEWCRKNKVNPYYMRHALCWCSPDQSLYTSLAAWCNQPAYFKKMPFPEFVQKRHPIGNTRAESDIKKYLEFSKPDKYLEVLECTL